MLSLSVVRSLVLRDYVNCEAEHSNSIAKASLYLSKQPTWRRDKMAGNGFPYLVFVPTKEVMRDQARLAAIARDIGMDFRGDLINGRLIFSWPELSAFLRSSARFYVFRPRILGIQDVHHRFSTLASKTIFMQKQYARPLATCGPCQTMRKGV